MNRIDNTHDSAAKSGDTACGRLPDIAICRRVRAAAAWPSGRHSGRYGTVGDAAAAAGGNGGDVAFCLDSGHSACQIWDPYATVRGAARIPKARASQRDR
ncbi:MAG: hypothetical protein V3R98_04220 [Alphaproteobacteria bacterium]